LFEKFFPFCALSDSVMAIMALTKLYQARSQGQQVTKKYRKNDLPNHALQYNEYFCAWVGLHKAVDHGKKPLLRVCIVSIADALSAQYLEYHINSPFWCNS
jgi:hypothetical protein